MAQALGYVTKTETGGYEGTLSTMSLKKRIRIVANRTKETDMQPDFRVYTEDRVEIGGGWNRVGKTSGRPYVSLTFAAPEFGSHKLYANLGRAAGQDDEDVMAILASVLGARKSKLPRLRRGGVIEGWSCGRRRTVVAALPVG